MCIAFARVWLCNTWIFFSLLSSPMNCYSTHTGIDTCKEDMTSQSLRQPQTCAKGQMSVISTQKVVNQPGTFFCTTHAFTNRNQIHRWQILEDLGPRDSIDMPFSTTQASADCFRSISRWNTIGLLIFPTSQEVHDSIWSWSKQKSKPQPFTWFYHVGFTVYPQKGSIVGFTTL